MNIEELREYCLSLKGVTEDLPFGESTLVFKIAGKIFCLTGMIGNFSINLKNDPEKNMELREQFTCIKPGYHMNKKHWNTVEVDGSLSDDRIKNLVDESYDSVVMKLPQKVQQEIKKL